MTRAGRWGLLGILVASGFLAGSACRDPTQLTVVLATDLACASFDRASIYVGTPQELAQKLDTLTAQAEATTCTNGRIGSIVVVPGNDESFAVRIVGRKKSSNCEADPTSGCIEARRRLGFVPHTPLKMPVLLATACLDVLCDSDKTCVQGQCVPSVVDPNQCIGDGCDEGVFDAGLDAPIVVDAGSDVIFDAPADVNPGNCVPPSDDAGANGLLWHFEGSMVEANGKVAPGSLPADASFVPGPVGCGSALAFGGVSALLAQNSSILKTTGFTLAFWLRTTTTNGPVINAITGVPGGWAVKTSNGALQASICLSNCTLVTGTTNVADGAWHHVLLSFTGGAASLTVDQLATIKQAASYVPSSAPTVIIGPTGTIDEVELTGTP